ncbi:hypothetical protein [Sinomonas sp. R1AF57]|uniref:hypothetical protein n=1 Tax=Sinomonas sp. R1AF57 TaxID=2020377 RepID=UPI00351075C8
MGRAAHDRRDAGPAGRLLRRYRRRAGRDGRPPRPREAAATGIAAAQTVVAVARLLASTGFGLLWYTVGSDAAMWLVAVVLAAALPVAAMLLRTARTAAA